MLESKLKLSNNKFVDDKYLEESQRWKGLFLDVLRNGNYDSVKVGRSKNISKCQLSAPLVREAKNRDEADFFYDSEGKAVGYGGLGNVGRFQIVSTLTGHTYENDVEPHDGRVFSLSYPCMDGFKQPIIVRAGTEIYKASGNTVYKLDDKINELGEDFRRQYTSDENISKFLKQYISICNNFVNEINK